MTDFNIWTEPFDYAWRAAVAYAVMALFLTVNVMAISFPFTGAVKVPYFLMVVYFWSIFRPSLLPVWFVFAAGMIMDSLTGLPLGLSALVFVLSRWFILDQRRFFLAHSFAAIWLGFGLLSIAAGFFQWVLYGLVSGGFPALKQLFLSCILAMGLFPLAALLLHGCNRLLPMTSPVFTLKGS
jgi:rod shape-determining protein MreD